MGGGKHSTKKQGSDEDCWGGGSGRFRLSMMDSTNPEVEISLGQIRLVRVDAGGKRKLQVCWVAKHWVHHSAS